MRSLVLIVALVAAACSGAADPTTSATTQSPTTSVSVQATTTTSTASTTTTTTTTVISSTTSSTLPGTRQILYEDRIFTIVLEDSWLPDPDFSNPGAGFVQDHSSQGLPPSYFSIAISPAEDGFALDEHAAQLQDDLAAFVVDFQLLNHGTGTVNENPSRWFAYVESFDGFEVVQRQEATVSQGTLVTFTLISPIDFYDFEAGRAVDVIGTFVEVAPR